MLRHESERWFVLPAGSVQAGFAWAGAEALPHRTLNPTTLLETIERVLRRPSEPNILYDRRTETWRCHVSTLGGFEVRWISSDSDEPSRPPAAYNDRRRRDVASPRLTVYATNSVSFRQLMGLSRIYCLTAFKEFLPRIIRS